MRTATIALAATLAACTTTPPEPPQPVPTTTQPSLPSTTSTSSTTTTTVKRVEKRRRLPSTQPAAAERPAPSATLAAIRECESGGDYGAVSASGKYLGAYQFDQRTWQSVGGTGSPAAASPAEQDARAAELMARRGTQPWPTCGRQR